VALGADHVQPARLVRLGRELDVGAAASHVRRDRHVADDLVMRVLMLLPGDGDDLRLALVVLGVEHLVLDAVLALEHLREHLALLDAGRADEHRAALVGGFLDLFEDGGPLLLLGAVDAVLAVLADDRAVRRDRDDFQPVDLRELFRLGLGRAGHAGQRLVELEEVLQRDRRQRLRLLLDRDALLGFDGLVQAVRPLAARPFFGRCIRRR
jgi:hypothetical protein